MIAMIRLKHEQKPFLDGGVKTAFRGISYALHNADHRGLSTRRRVTAAALTLRNRLRNRLRNGRTQHIFRGGPNFRDMISCLSTGQRIP